MFATVISKFITALHQRRLHNGVHGKRPAGGRLTMFIVAGAGASGGCGLNTGASSGGGCGGGTGGLSILTIPTAMLPDQLYVYGGMGGKQPATLVSAATCVAGIESRVALEPTTSAVAQLTVIYALGGASGGTAATTTAGGIAPAAVAAATNTSMVFGMRGLYQLYAGLQGTAGGASSNQPNTTQLDQGNAWLMPGGGGAGSQGSSQFSYQIPHWIDSTDAYNRYPAGTWSPLDVDGWSPGFMKYLSMGGIGGCGCGASGSQRAGAGGNGGPGAGGGGAGGASTTNATLARPGNGGDGFVLIITK